jgi:acyl dehydratase
MAVATSPPRLGRLYAKAALGAVRRRGRELPDTELLREDVPVDRAHLAEYAHVCGFAVADTLPATYPHVLAFGLQVSLMADRAFPLPLPGLVHIRNTITVHRPLDAAERVTMRVGARAFGPHPKGAQVDLVAEIDVGGARVWEGRSTYLARGVTAPGSAPPSRPELPEITTGPPVAIWRVGAGTGRRYAHASGDVNPIHLHPLTARAFGFPRAIAHGMWTAAHALAALQGRLSEAFTYEVAFGRPLLLPSTVALRTRRADDGWDLDVRSKTGMHLAATVRTPGRNVVG